MQKISKSIMIAAICSLSAGFAPGQISFTSVALNDLVMDPNTTMPVGYITDFSGLNKDLRVTVPMKPTYPQLPVSGVFPYIGNVTGLITSFTWAGGASDPIALQFYVSQTNANQLAARIGAGYGTSPIQAGWWLANYDHELRVYYEQHNPLSVPVLQATPQGTMSVDPTPAGSVGNVQFYKVTLKILPQAHQVNSLLVATSAKTPMTKTWGQQ